MTMNVPMILAFISGWALGSFAIYCYVMLDSRGGSSDDENDDIEAEAA